MFVLDPKLEANTSRVVRWELCQVLLMEDSRFPWMILVPEREDIREIHDLLPPDQGLLWGEIVHAARLLETITSADKMNVAALGNQVPQLHVHVIARYVSDAAWPKPVWGVGEPVPYHTKDRDDLIEEIRALPTP